MEKILETWKLIQQKWMKKKLQKNLLSKWILNVTLMKIMKMNNNKVKILVLLKNKNQRKDKKCNKNINKGNYKSKNNKKNFKKLVKKKILMLWQVISLLIFNIKNVKLTKFYGVINNISIFKL